MSYRLRTNNPASINESNLLYGIRTGARTLARGFETVAGLPADIVQGIGQVANYGIGKLTGKENFIPQEAIKSAQAGLPTSEEIRQHGTKRLTGEYLEPKSSGEESYDQIISDAAALFVPGKAKVPFLKQIGGALGKSVIGNAAQWATEKVTGSPFLGVGAKIGSIALAGTAGGRRELTKLQKQSYKDAFAEIPENTKFDLSPTIQKLEKIAERIKKGDNPDKKFILERLDSINNIGTEAGKGNIVDAINLKQDWNQYLSDKSLSKNSRDYVKQAVGTINKGIERYGETNPKFYNPYKIGEELTGALKSTNYVQNFIAEHPKLKQLTNNRLVQHLLFVGGYHGASHLSYPQIAAIGSGALGIHESAKTFQLLIKSPVAQRYYKGFIEASLKNDVKTAAKYLSKLNKSANEFEKNNPDEQSTKGKYQLRN